MILHQLGLYFHMFSLLLVGGGNLALFLTERALWKKIEARTADAAVLVPLLESAPVFIQVGSVLFLFSGLTMLASYNWVFLSQPWFITKVSLFMMLPLRGLLIGKKMVSQIAGHVGNFETAGGYDLMALHRLKFRMRRFHAVQYALVAVIIFLVIFRPSFGFL